MTEIYGNPSSLHTLGIRAEEVLGSSRRTVAQALGVSSGEIYFTSGGTEANNLAVLGTAKWLRKRGNRIVTTAIEHSSVAESMNELEEEGFEVIRLTPDSSGHISPESFENSINEKTILVSSMYVNNETGLILPVDKLKRIIEDKNSPAVLHSDCVQAFCKIPVKPQKLGIDIATVSAHKLHAPKGVGAIYIRKGLHTKPRQFGGEQERKIRPGTEPLPLIAAFAEAIKEINISANYRAVTALNELLRKKLAEMNLTINSPSDALPYILNFSVPGIRSETMLHFLASEGIYVSSGSACAKGKPSHVLTAMGLNKNTADSALRVSFSAENTADDITALTEAIARGKNTLATR